MLDTPIGSSRAESRFARAVTGRWEAWPVLDRIPVCGPLAAAPLALPLPVFDEATLFAEVSRLQMLKRAAELPPPPPPLLLPLEVWLKLELDRE
jgi:hypothetical protein